MARYNNIGDENEGFLFDRKGLQTNPHPSQRFYSFRVESLQNVLTNLPNESQMRICGNEAHEKALAIVFPSPERLVNARCSLGGMDLIRSCLCSQGKDIESGFANNNHLCAHRFSQSLAPAPLLEHLTAMQHHKLLESDPWMGWYEDIREKIRVNDRSVAARRYEPLRMEGPVQVSRQTQETLKKDMLKAIDLFRMMIHQAIAYGQSAKT